MTPFGVKNKMTGETIPVPCGKCPACVGARQSAWSFRLMQEERISTSAYFITLTYDTKHVPLTRHGFMSLTKRDPQLFMKRLRKQCDNKVKYYLVGEYGGKTVRPHYHAIIFNADITKIQESWQLGQVHYGTVTGASIGYCLKYMSKTKKIPLHGNDDRTSEFALMSKGLGKNYLSDNILEWHFSKLEERMYCTLRDGRKVTMPRYYKDKIFSDTNFETAEKAAIVRKRVAFYTRLRQVAEQRKEEEKGGENYYRDKAENDAAAFRRMHIQSQKNQKI